MGPKSGTKIGVTKGVYHVRWSRKTVPVLVTEKIQNVSRRAFFVLSRLYHLGNGSIGMWHRYVRPSVRSSVRPSVRPSPRRRGAAAPRRRGPKMSYCEDVAIISAAPRRRGPKMRFCVGVARISERRVFGSKNRGVRKLFLCASAVKSEDFRQNPPSGI